MLALVNDLPIKFRYMKSKEGRIIGITGVSPQILDTVIDLCLAYRKTPTSPCVTGVVGYHSEQDETIAAIRADGGYDVNSKGYVVLRFDYRPHRGVLKQPLEFDRVRSIFTSANLEFNARTCPDFGAMVRRKATLLGKGKEEYKDGGLNLPDYPDYMKLYLLFDMETKARDQYHRDALEELRPGWRGVRWGSFGSPVGMCDMGNRDRFEHLLDRTNPNSMFSFLKKPSESAKKNHKRLADAYVKSLNRRADKKVSGS